GVSTHGLHAKKGAQFLSFLFLFLEGILLLRFLLKLFGADPGNLFAGFLYALTDIILFTFANIFRPLLLAPRPNPIYLTVPLLEWSTLLAMILYGMIFWGILRGLGMNIFGRKQ
ncbi:MAG TPA: hypothetical protein VGU68_08385, partial [Ktedonobacteraceae bacterium]|nr:hypothetical protein [Ktedonobacteraceae bacterium]